MSNDRLAPQGRRRLFAVAVESVPCIAPGCGAQPGEPCKNQHPEVEAKKRKPRFHRHRTIMAREVGLNYVDTLADIENLPTALPAEATG